MVDDGSGFDNPAGDDNPGERIIGGFKDREVIVNRIEAAGITPASVLRTLIYNAANAAEALSSGRMRPGARKAAENTAASYGLPTKASDLLEARSALAELRPLLRIEQVDNDVLTRLEDSGIDRKAAFRSLADFAQYTASFRFQDLNAQWDSLEALEASLKQAERLGLPPDDKSKLLKLKMAFWRLNSVLEKTDYS